jgi:hypothetical protein
MADKRKQQALTAAMRAAEARDARTAEKTQRALRLAFYARRTG